MATHVLTLVPSSASESPASGTVYMHLCSPPLCFLAVATLAFPRQALFNFTQVVGLIAVGLLAIQGAIAQEHRSREHFELQVAIDSADKRFAEILQTLLPPFVLNELRRISLAGTLPSHHYSSATIAQSDLVGFTKLASTRSPEEVVKFIGELFGLFDDLTDRHAVYKIETVGDAYIAGQAVYPLSLVHKPLSVVLFGYDMIQATDEWSLRKGVAVKCRVGVHTGACTGGVVGTEMQRYHLFGQLLSIVEALESTAPTGQVQVSNACKQAVEIQMQEDSITSKIPVFEARSDPELLTSKGDVVDFGEVGGKPTFLFRGCTPDARSSEFDLLA
eukprot:TRINITY_DN15765_c0_g1_i1.p1 TRINITY_DN15765_c0_g1~~TRINITY_DN15765_c0_g1_i1.p1  ORF type:complete len:332 (+),score=51.53 TRINITY_DN15765_c0_g1_i1:368-1363(+)